MKHLLLSVSLFWGIHIACAQSFWTPRQAVNTRHTTELPNQYSAFDLEERGLWAKLQSVKSASHSSPQVISLPLGQGNQADFRVWEGSIMAPALAMKYPEIWVFEGEMVDQPNVRLKANWGKGQFHAMISGPEETIYLDPVRDTDHQYVVYESQHRRSGEAFTCETHGEEALFEQMSHIHHRGISGLTGEDLYTYRLAMAADSAYTAFHGGTKSDALAAMAVVVNRVNGVFEREFSIHLELIPNNDQLIFTGADGYTNGDIFAMWAQNQSVLNSIIGSGNYDIGHVLGKLNGFGVVGLASLGSVCGSFKARGASGLPSPIGDGYMVEVVCHEMGHQFGATHTFNSNGGSCQDNRTGITAYEPGSGSTIMSYPGECGHVIQTSGDDYFHTGSFSQIYQFTRFGNGSNCVSTSPTGNHSPTADAGPSGYIIPISTPFELVGSASDIDGDDLTYNWEQYDLGPAGAPNSPTGNAPLFRSIRPDTLLSRAFPRYQNIIAGTQTTGEILPNYSRDMQFRFTVRDNHPGSGGVDFDLMTMSVTDQAGPFRVLEPNLVTTWTSGFLYDVEWDVAGTDQSPVNCQSVNLKLSTDGGYTYPITLASNIPNDGFAQVVAPDVSGNTMRLRVEAADNVFFDISDEHFQIQPSTIAGFNLYTLSQDELLCESDTVQFDLLTTSLLGFQGAINFYLLNAPADVELLPGANPVIPGDSVQVSLVIPDSLAAGTYTWDLLGVASNGFSGATQLTLTVVGNQIQTADLLYPLSGVGQAQAPIFGWSPVLGADFYEVEVSDDPAFGASVIWSGSTNLTSIQPPVNLDFLSVYYWRVKAHTPCGFGDFSSVGGFQTGLCVSAQSSGGPQPISEFSFPAVASSQVVAPFAGTVLFIRMNNITGDHPAIDQLSGTLTSPAGTKLSVFEGLCTANASAFDLTLDDQSVMELSDCPSVWNGAFRPSNSLAQFHGEDAQGAWTLEVRDSTVGQGGTLNGWELEVCFGTSTDLAITNLNPLSILRYDTKAIDGNLLLAQESGTMSGDLTFKLLSDPLYGTVYKNAIELEVGETFTQSDVDQGLIEYRQGGSIIPVDSFQIEVSSTSGAWVGTPFFKVNVDLSNVSIDPEAGWELDIYPNPVSDVLHIKLNALQTGAWNLKVLDLQGRVLHQAIHSADGGLFQTEVHMKDWAKGIYLIQLTGLQGHISRKVILE
ncbi:reprolysin-like metallopeptidase [Pontibacter sp. G13]|uniref:reprolysin-like metallopeptidase n=1 Tax=Pontibacter sp. G13 TaxID=3074898 RepID=UPI00288AD249|nr:M12 family metallo-peptidase [Pontibacter sp. G13]WNJ15939.1 M12 family metallo-peptidase [Pontibacter sp. G13]